MVHHDDLFCASRVILCVYLSTAKWLRVCAAALPAQPPALNHSSSSEDEARQSGGTAVRRRRLRKNTTSVATEPDEDEEVLETEQSEEETDEGQRQEQQDVGADAAVRGVHGQTSSVFNMCVLIALIVAVSVGFRHFQGTFQLKSFLFIIKNLLSLQLLGKIHAVH